MNWAGGTAGIKSIVITLSFVFLFVVAVLLDLQYLYLMAVTLAVLPLSSYGLAYFFATRFIAHRTHAPTVPEGRRVEVKLYLEARGGLPQSALRVADTVPTLLSAPEERAALRAPQALEQWDGEEGYLSYTVEPQKRGVYTIGPARIETTDPLGLFTFSAPLSVTTEIVVHPEPLMTRDLSVGGEGTYGIRERDGKTRRGEGMDFHGVREYRYGDALRRVHWRTTARTGKLAVVEFERAYQQDVIIALDRAKGTNYGQGREATLEYAIKVAATLAERTLAAGGGVTLITQGAKASIRPREGDPAAARFRLFDLLARIEADAETSLGDDLAAARLTDGTHYAVLTSQGDPRLSAYLTKRVQHGDSVRIYFFEPGSFGGPRVMSPAIAGGELRVIEQEHSPWADGGKQLEYLLRESA
jgi:uncharacterized protein (DUF58 family)